MIDVVVPQSSRHGARNYNPPTCDTVPQTREASEAPSDPPRPRFSPALAASVPMSRVGEPQNPAKPSTSTHGSTGGGASRAPEERDLTSVYDTFKVSDRMGYLG
jgi:hypothetical protein